MPPLTISKDELNSGLDIYCIMSATVIIGKHAVKGFLLPINMLKSFIFVSDKKINEDLNKMIVLAKKTYSFAVA